MKTFKLSTEYGEIFVWDSEGSGAVCMMIHGNSQSSAQFHAQFSALGNKYRLIAWDLPGHGQSDQLKTPESYHIETYAKIGHLILQQLSLDTVALFGWSLGGHIAIEMIKQWQNNINSLMITGTPACELSKEGLAQAFKSNADIARLATSEEWTLEDAKSWVRYSGLDPDNNLEAVRVALNTDGKSRVHMLKHLGTRGDNQLIDLENFQGQVEIVIGGTDQHINNDYIRESVVHLKLFKGFTEMPSAGHTPFLEQPEEFNSHFERFLSKSAK